MRSSTNLPILFFLIAFNIFFTFTHAATFEILNQCSFTVWAAAVPGGGQQLNQDQSWTINVPAGTTQARIWGRTNCIFDASGRGKCETGDCDGLLQCQSYGTPPVTIAEYALNQFNDMDFFDLSLVDGFNIRMDFSPTTGNCRGMRCSADINEQCPIELKAPGGCNNPCTVFKTDIYCCNSNYSINCGPTNFSRYFKGKCPDAYSYPLDDQTSTFTCPGGTNYKVVFCPVVRTYAATLEIRNQCPYTVWAAAVPGGGLQLKQGQSWTINMNAYSTSGRIWGRTDCYFDASGQGKCQTGDCGGLIQCHDYGTPPNTVVEYSLNQFNNMDFYQISLVDGFNIPMSFSPTTGICRGIGCSIDINECLDELKAPGGCNSACVAFKTDEYCCFNRDCEPNNYSKPDNYSKFFKDRCPDAYSYPLDDATDRFTCPRGPNYRIVFCPDSLRLIM